MDGRMIRLKYRITQRLVARLAGISQAQVCRIETGCATVSQAAYDRYDAAIRKIEDPAAASAEERTSMAISLLDEIRVLVERQVRA